MHWQSVLGLSMLAHLLTNSACLLVQGIEQALSELSQQHILIKAGSGLGFGSEPAVRNNFPPKPPDEDTQLLSGVPFVLVYIKLSVCRCCLLWIYLFPVITTTCYHPCVVIG